MAHDLLARAADLRRRGTPFVLATVVRCEAPTSAKPGAKALVLEDGTVMGWVGGVCAEPIVIREARQALRDGTPRLLGLYGADARKRDRTEGMLEYAMTCHSGGTLEIYVEPYLPTPLMLLVGRGPVIDALVALGGGLDRSVLVLGPDTMRDELDRLTLTSTAAVVVATHGDGDEVALERILATEAGYVSLVASRRRAAVIVEDLKRRGVPSERLARLKAPAGLDIGASTPEEIAVSILAEIILHGRGPAVEPTHGMPARAAEARDPVCGMLVDVAIARYRSEVSGHAVYFCCLQCKETFDRDPQPHLAGLA